jgi:hypothetical protein
MEVVRCVLPAEPLQESLPEFTVLSSSSTNRTDCAAVLASLVCAGEDEFCRSLRTVAKDWAGDRSPDDSALPSDATSVDS